jgi:hypothetical protein
VAAFVADSLAPATRRAYAAAWSHFEKGRLEASDHVSQLLGDADVDMLVAAMTKPDDQRMLDSVLYSPPIPIDQQSLLALNVLSPLARVSTRWVPGP